MKTLNQLQNTNIRININSELLQFIIKWLGFSPRRDWSCQNEECTMAPDPLSKSIFSSKKIKPFF